MSPVWGECFTVHYSTENLVHAVTIDDRSLRYHITRHTVFFNHRQLIEI